VFHGLWLLCGLGAAVFAASIRQSWYNLATVGCGFLITAIEIDPSHLPEPVWVGASTAGLALLVLAKPSWAFLAALGSGALAGTLSALLQAQFMPRAAACLLVAVVVLLSLILASERPDFAPLPMREEAMLVLATLGLLLAIAPALVQGWQSALALNIAEKGGSDRAFPLWVIALGAGSALVGAFSAIRHSRRPGKNP
jgi:hypothetical protein